jgi:hypothetical protein
MLLQLCPCIMCEALQSIATNEYGVAAVDLFQNYSSNQGDRF